MQFFNYWIYSSIYKVLQCYTIYRACKAFYIYFRVHFCLLESSIWIGHNAVCCVRYVFDKPVLSSTLCQVTLFFFKFKFLQGIKLKSTFLPTHWYWFYIKKINQKIRKYIEYKMRQNDSECEGLCSYWRSPGWSSTGRRTPPLSKHKVITACKYAQLFYKQFVCPSVQCFRLWLLRKLYSHAQKFFGKLVVILLNNLYINNFSVKLNLVF